MAHSTSSSIRDSISSSWRSLIARCNAREKRQRLCSVMTVFSRTGCAKQQLSRNGRLWRDVIGDVRPGCCTYSLKPQIVQFGGNATVILHAGIAGVHGLPSRTMTPCDDTARCRLRAFSDAPASYPRINETSALPGGFLRMGDSSSTFSRRSDNEEIRFAGARRYAGAVKRDRRLGAEPNVE